MIRIVTRAVAVLLLLAVYAPADLTAAARPQEAAPRKCCFTNPGYAGTCEVEPAKDETCKQVLDYLNNPMSQGKGYCGNTQVRGGWEIAACEPKK